LEYGFNVEGLETMAEGLECRILSKFWP